MSHYYTDLLPSDLKKELLQYFKLYDLIKSCNKNSLIYNNTCDDEIFWQKRIFSDFNWFVLMDVITVTETINNTIDKFGAKNTYKLFSRLYREATESISYIDFDLLIGNIMSEFKFGNLITNFIDEIVTKEEALQILMTNQDHRNYIIKNMDSANVAQYLYNTYPEYRVPILFVILLLRNKKFKLDFMDGVKNLPMFLYGDLVKIFDTIPFTGETYEQIDEEFSVDNILNAIKK